MDNQNKNNNPQASGSGGLNIEPLHNIEPVQHITPVQPVVQPAQPINPQQPNMAVPQAGMNPQPLQGVAPMNPGGQQITAADISSKPPVSVQILYALAFMGLILGLLGIVLIFVAASSFSLGGLGGVSAVIALVFGALISLGFFIVHEIRRGKLWALIVYSVLLGISIVSDLISLGSNIDIASLVINGFIATLVVMMWTKDRAYFS